MPGLTLQREGGLGTGCKEDIASPSSVMVEETPGGGWDRGVGRHGDGLQGDSWQAGEIGEVRVQITACDDSQA